MDTNKIKLSLTKYKMKSFQLLIGSKKIEVPQEEIVSFCIIENFDKYYFPYFEMTLSVDNSTYRLISKNSTKIKANISLYKGKFNELLRTEDNSTTSFKKAISGSFKVFLDNSTPDLSEKEEKKIDKDGTKYGQLTTFKIILYPNLYYNKYDIVINGAFLNVTLAEMVGYILTKTKMTKVLMSPPTNYKKYKQFLLPRIPTCERLTRICDTYALHKNGSIVYFGLDRAYIIDKVPKCTAYAKNEYKITYILYKSSSKAVSNSGGCYASSKDKYNVLNAVRFDTANKREVVNKSAGKNIVSVNSNGGITKSNKKASKVTRVVVQNEGNSTVRSMKREIKENKKILTAQFVDVDINMITPNKQFIVSVEGATYKKYNGKYRLTKAVHNFVKEGDYFQLTSSCEFKG